MPVREKDQDAAAEKNSGENAAPLNIGLMGARCSRGVLEMIRGYNINLLFDMTCTGVDRRFEIDGELLRSGGKDAPPSGAAAEEENDATAQRNVSGSGPSALGVQRTAPLSDSVYEDERYVCKG